MTEYQELMLAVCFGGMVGIILADVGILIRQLVLHIRDKRRKRKEAKEAQQQSK